MNYQNNNPSISLAKNSKAVLDPRIVKLEKDNQ